MDPAHRTTKLQELQYQSESAMCILCANPNPMLHQFTRNGAHRTVPAVVDAARCICDVLHHEVGKNLKTATRKVRRRVGADDIRRGGGVRR